MVVEAAATATAPVGAEGNGCQLFVMQERKNGGRRGRRRPRCFGV